MKTAQDLIAWLESEERRLDELQRAEYEAFKLALDLYPDGTHEASRAYAASGEASFHRNEIRSVLTKVLAHLAASRPGKLPICGAPEGQRATFHGPGAAASVSAYAEATTDRIVVRPSAGVDVDTLADDLAEWVIAQRDRVRAAASVGAYAEEGEDESCDCRCVRCNALYSARGCSRYRCRGLPETHCTGCARRYREGT